MNKIDVTFLEKITASRLEFINAFWLKDRSFKDPKTHQKMIDHLLALIDDLEDYMKEVQENERSESNV